MSEHAIIWEPVSGIDSPCAELSLFLEPSRRLKVLMHFSKVKDGPTLDLELLFSGAVTLRWADEFTGSIFHPMSVLAPKCRNERWSEWVFPLLVIQESPWLATYQSIAELPGTQSLQHFALICMNDLLDIAATPDVVARWVTPTQSIV
jgi:hypothetical protein